MGFLSDNCHSSLTTLTPTWRNARQTKTRGILLSSPRQLYCVKVFFFSEKQTGFCQCQSNFVPWQKNMSMYYYFNGAFILLPFYIRIFASHVVSSCTSSSCPKVACQHKVDLWTPLWRKQRTPTKKIDEAPSHDRPWANLTQTPLTFQLLQLGLLRCVVRWRLASESRQSIRERRRIGK